MSARGEAARASGGSGDGAAPDARPRAPVVSIVLMVLFMVGGSIGLVADWPAGPANLDWGVWVVLYGGYGYVIAAAIYHARTGR